MLIAITGLRIRRTAITLLDEPTNNLDRLTRAKLAEFVDTWPGTLVVVSHDLELLEHMDNTAELHAGNIETFGGPYSAWTEYQEHEQTAATQAARSAQQTLKVEKRQRVEAETKLARRERTAKKTQKDGGIPKILAGARANKAQGSAGSMRTTLDDKVQAAQAAVDAADARVRGDEHIHLTLPDPDVPRSRRLAEIHDENRTIVIQGPERVALVGPNGAGKSTLIQQLVNGSTPTAGRAHGTLLTDRIGYLPQRLDGLDDTDERTRERPRRRARRNRRERSATNSPGCYCAATASTAPSQHSPEENASAFPSRSSSSPIRLRSSSSSTSPRTTSTSPVSSSSPRRWRATEGRSSSSVTTTPS